MPVNFATKAFFFFWRNHFQFFFSLLLLSFFSPFLFSLSSTLYSLSWVSCLSKQSGDVKNDDVTSGSMSPGRKRPKNKTLGGKESIAPKAEAILQILYTWHSQFKFWSICAPRDFADDTCNTGCSFILKEGVSESVDSFCLDATNINSVLV